MKSDLSFIRCHMGFLTGAIKQLEETGLPLTSSLAIVNNAQQKIAEIPGEKGKILKAKLDQVLEKNSALKILEKVGKVLCGEEGSELCKVPYII